MRFSGFPFDALDCSFRNSLLPPYEESG